MKATKVLKRPNENMTVAKNMNTLKKVQQLQLKGCKSTETEADFKH